MAFDAERSREIFESSTDFTVGLEEEFALLDPGTLSLVDRFEELQARGASATTCSPTRSPGS